MHSLPHADPQTSAHTDSSESTEPASGDQEPAEGSSSAVTAGDTAHSADYAQISAAETDAYTGNAPKKHHSAPGERDCSNNTEKRSPSASDSDECTERLSPQKGNPTPKLDLGPTEERVSGEACSATTANKANEMEADRPESCEDEDTRQGDGAAAAEQKRQEEEEEEEEEAEAEAATKKRTMMCKECGKVFNRRETFNLHRHFHLHEDELKPLTCKECGLTFQQRSSFIKHRKEHKQKDMEGVRVKRGDGKQEQKNFQCAACSTVFLAVEKLRNHKCGFSDDMLFHCPICRQEFTALAPIKRHMLTHSQENLQCTQCFRTFQNAVCLASHKKNHKKPNFENPDPGLAFEQHPSARVDHQHKQTESSASYPCNVCGKSFKYSSQLNQHQFLHTGKKPFHCSECGKSFAFAQNLKAHSRLHSLGIIPDAAEKSKTSNSLQALAQAAVKRCEKENVLQNKEVPHTYKCPLCHQNFTTPANLRIHMHTHEAEYEMDRAPRSPKEPLKWTHNCPHCTSIFCDELSLKVHVSTFHKAELPNNSPVLACKAVPSQSSNNVPEFDKDVKSFACSECGKSFRHRSVLELHMRIHSKDKPYQCKVCGKSFRFSSYLQQHLIIHTGKRPYKCPDCGRAFAFLQNMKTHQKLHQEKPFRCSSCHKGYSDQAQLDTHLLCHRGERPHRCNICDKAFGLAYQLLDHMNTHTGARPHRCEVCNKSFTWLSSLLVHKKAHKRQIQNTLEMEDSMSRTSKDKWAASSPFEGLGLVGLSDIPVSDAEMHKIVDQPPPISAASLEQTPQKMNELPPPVHWKADIGGELTAVLSPHKAFLALPTQPHSMPGKVLVSPHRMETSPSYISPGPSYVPQKTVATETEQQRQLQAVWSSPQSTVAPTSSLLSSHAVSYIDGAALWSVRPPAANLNLHNSPKKMNKDMQSPTWQGTLMPSQANLPSPLQKGELQKWDMASPQVQAIMQSEKAWVSGLSNASTLSQMPPHGIGARWDIQTSPGMQKALKSPDHLLSSPDFQLQQKQLLPFMSIPFEPQRFAQTISAPMWGFQSNPVAAQAILKAGNMQDLQQQNAKLIMNQPPHFFPPLQSLPPLGLPPSHPLHSVSVGVFPRPPHPNLFFPPQVSQVLSHKLGPPRLAFPTDRLPQCMICGRTLPREVDLQMHYMQHAQGEI
ncbi:unnamed protein product [Knipowitschia caucasica]